jgi:hypothetical protein
MNPQTSTLKTNLDKLRQLLANATTAKQKIMYANLIRETRQKLDAIAPPQNQPNLENRSSESKESQKSTNTAKNQQNLEKKLSSNKKSTSNSKNRQKSLKNFSGSTSKALEKSNKPSSAKTQEKSLSSQSSKSAAPGQTITNKHNPSSTKTTDKAIFQAIGVLEGWIFIDNRDGLSISFNDRTYQLNYSSRSKAKIYPNLKAEVRAKGKVWKRISVYPEIRFNPTTKTSKIRFKLVTVSQEPIKGVFLALATGQFRLSGFWQYIPSSNRPCISIYRNYNSFLAKITKGNPTKAKLLLLPSHIPLTWDSPSIEPFNYLDTKNTNSKLTEHFIELTARFDSDNNAFIVDSNTKIDTQKAPRFLKLTLN